MASGVGVTYELEFVIKESNGYSLCKRKLKG